LVPTPMYMPAGHESNVVGVAVGAVEGAVVGSVVGEKEGVAEGRAVGWSVGAAVGVSVAAVWQDVEPALAVIPAGHGPSQSAEVAASCVPKLPALHAPMHSAA
jgi:hypothetical protein